MIEQVGLFSGLVLLGCVSAQHVFELHRHMAPLTTLDHIPTQFEIHSNNPQREFEKYANRIHHLAKHDNKTVIYKIKVEVVRHHNVQNILKKYYKKGNSKKYNVPLKKTSMKLSNFEALVRKMAENNNHAASPGNVINEGPTTNRVFRFTTKPIHTKFKPFISKLNNYTKIIKPVRSKIITLTN